MAINTDPVYFNTLNTNTNTNTTTTCNTVYYNWTGYEQNIAANSANAKWVVIPSTTTTNIPNVIIGTGGAGGSNGTFIPGITFPYNGWNPFIPDIVPEKEADDLAVVVEKEEEKSEGCACKKCEDFCSFAEPNQKDGSFLCWSCRNNY